PISEPSQPKKIVPGTFRFAHGLGAGDLNGDGRMDVLCTGGWWEQPEKVGDQPWKFHAATLGPNCADMHVFDVDGDGKNDIITSSAHDYGLWWPQHKPGKDGPTFIRREFFPLPDYKPTLPKNVEMSKDEQALFALINKHRAENRLAPY